MLVADIQNMEQNITILATYRGDALKWEKGKLEAPEEYLTVIQEAVRHKQEVELISNSADAVVASFDTPLGVVAAMFSISPRRVQLLEAPEEVWEYLDYDLTVSDAVEKSAEGAKVFVEEE